MLFVYAIALPNNNRTNPKTQQTPPIVLPNHKVIAFVGLLFGYLYHWLSKSLPMPIIATQRIVYFFGHKHRQYIAQIYRLNIQFPPFGHNRL